jgi:hypothetical protein
MALVAGAVDIGNSPLAHHALYRAPHPLGGDDDDADRWFEVLRAVEKHLAVGRRMNSNSGLQGRFVVQAGRASILTSARLAKRCA